MGVRALWNKKIIPLKVLCVQINFRLQMSISNKLHNNVVLFTLFKNPNAVEETCGVAVAN